ncbi:MAG: HmuY family protein [Muribaculum sp.]|nr:HmuY family protein [Muribaculaceae bacterium]MCM1080707.1 HmuY family protein [Muribaculum sp.]
MKHLLYIIVALLALSSISCSSDDNNDNGNNIPPTDTELTITGLSDNQWTYISLSKNAIVGTSPLDDAKTDAEWAERLDWDIAICGDLMRTNSGTSGHGKGGLRRLDGVDYNNITDKDIPVDTDRPNSPSSPMQ